MNLLSGLNSQQQKAIMADAGPVLVLAGPGSGKTRVLTQRIAYLIASMGVRPYHIFAVTFTNKAAREMKNRVINILGQQTMGLTLGTFHGACARILRREAEHLPIDSNFVIFDADDQIRVVKQVLKDLNIDEKRHRPHGIHAGISRAKNELILAEKYSAQSYKDEVVKRVYERYQQTLLASNAVDFDDLLLWTAHLLENNPIVRERYARRYEHILVDEFQDTNMAQYTLLKHLASYHQNIFVVGDADQSIYRWRGADYRNVLRFERDFPAAEVILLEQNYRSSQNILDTAMAVINRNPNRTEKKLFTERGGGQKVVVREAYDDREMASFVVTTIAKQVSTKRAGPGDFAIMYRTNAQSRVLEEAFLAANLPYKLVGAQRFYGRREIKDIIAYLRLAHNPKDEISLLRVINLPRRGIGTKTMSLLRTTAQQFGLSSAALTMDLARSTDCPHWDTFSQRAGSSLAGFGKGLLSWCKLAVDSSPLALMDRILEDISYRAYIDDGTEEGGQRWENVIELRRLAMENQDQGLGTFLENIALVSDQDTIDASAKVPTLLTLHAAKGLEFPTVFITGLNDGTLPHIRSFDDPEAMQEERRLLYVGLTRAENQLYLLYALNQFRYGFTEPAEPSRYLEDIPANLTDDASNGSGARHAPASMKSYANWESPSSSVELVEQKFNASMRVRHVSWGEGLVLNSKIDDGDEIVDIFFDDVGLKRLVAAIAKLEIIS
ncbi:MAG: UvrD-helicase domain-containing protein [Chloroflexi bacterium]|nr:UvrD-helicase domain-containing protein [Chloroflexota bacterium]